MDAAVRQREIMVLLLSSSEPLSLTELSHRYAVSTRTIQRDIDALTPLAPIRIRQGRYGGVFLLPTKLITMANMQITTLNKVLQDANHCICELTPDQIETLEHLIDYITNYVTEKASVWDKARIARIIDNAKYIGFDDYDPIIDEEIYEEAVNAKIARQRGVVERECEAINLLRNRVKCATCGSPMVRRICSKNRIKESWSCTNNECECRVRISDADLIQKITIIINRITAQCNAFCLQCVNRRIYPMYRKIQ